jgi:hypothetical protein
MPGLLHLDFFSAVTGPSFELKTGSGRYRYQDFLRKKPGAACHIQMLLPCSRPH